MRVDIHNHFYPGSYLQLLEEKGIDIRVLTDDQGRRYLEEAGSRLVTLTSPMVTLEERFQMMHREGVDVHVISLTSPNVYAFPPRDSVAVARMANDEYAAIRDRHPRRIRCFASVPLGTGEEIEELDRAIVRLGLDGLVVGTNIHGKTLDDPSFAPFWRRANELKIPVLVHPMAPMVGTRYMERFASVPLIGFVFDTTLAFSRLLWSGFLEEHPDIRFIALHTGGALPYLAGRLTIGHEAYPECRRIPHRPEWYLKRLFYDTVSYHAAALRCLADTVGASRMVFGTDYPHVIGDPSWVIRSLEETGFTPEELEAIYWHNTAEGLGISLP